MNHLYPSALHRQTRGFLALFLASLLWAQPLLAEPPLPAYQWQTPAPGIHVAVKPAAHRFIDSNVTIIENAEDLIIVDANDNLTNAKQLIADIKQRWSKPVSAVITTHWHSDHLLANHYYRQAFGSDVQFIGHASLQQTIPTKAQAQLTERINNWQTAIDKAQQTLSQNPLDTALAEKIKRAEQTLTELQGIELRIPDVTFNEKMVLKRPGRSIELLFFGPAHTAGDTVVYLPDDKVLISGDLFDEIPFGGHGFLQSWLSTLQQIDTLNFTQVIPGHGAIHRDRRYLQQVTALIADALTRARLAHQKQQDEATFLAQLPLDSLRQPFSGQDELAGRVSAQFIPEFYTLAYRQTQP
ncbi:MAG: MBL fold metallo-hydrolase [Gammaproteobacteria bacterium]|nr:MBL fold metallo-hydrolase [Gammaproteobacteria bacterium]